MDKYILFEAVRKGGALPRKAFSMGEAVENDRFSWQLPRGVQAAGHLLTQTQPGPVSTAYDAGPPVPGAANRPQVAR